MKTLPFCLSLIVCAVASGQATVPRFEDYPVLESWNATNAPVKLATASERMFRTRLTEASKRAPNFAGHYRFAFWGCGSVGAAGALVDLHTGEVFPPPRRENESGWDRWIFAGGFVDGQYMDFRLDSRFVVVREQASDPAMQDVRYFVWENRRFREVLTIKEKKRLP